MFDVFLEIFNFQECIFGKFSYKTELDLVPFIKQYIESSLRKNCHAVKREKLFNSSTNFAYCSFNFPLANVKFFKFV